MDIETFREYCLSKKASTESFPFDEHTLVFKVMGKMFAILPLEHENPRVNLKADPEYSIELRERYEQIFPGWHMNKHHWNTVELETGLDDSLILELVDHSYELILAGLTKKLRTEYENL
ncbi:MAG: MmcQ/YjbR family DNA-binding protein [Bacteroidia bacterium]|nr:MmcQ/YjbR family DNA-binding protein [Bacteroidia bacterium]MBT8229685.1 MmcQ/YjbR family DNA-binding protein [Bacteroidia bacterium]NNK90491.1 MmcQ/YjbR family DNA-binding protein [Saprospiraceae bacterium]